MKGEVYYSKLCFVGKGTVNFSPQLWAKIFQKDDLHKFKSEKKDGHTCSVVTKETNELVYLNENVGFSSSHVCYSRENKCSKGTSSFLGGCLILCIFYKPFLNFIIHTVVGKTQAKPKFSFRFQSNKEDSFEPFITKDKSRRSSEVG